MRSEPSFSMPRYVAIAAHVLCAATLQMAQAQTTNSNNLTVLGFVDATNYFSYGSLTNGDPAVYLQYTNDTATFSAANASTSFIWQDNLNDGIENKMQLDQTNTLTLYSTNGSVGVKISPSSGVINLIGTNSGLVFSDGSLITSVTSLQGALFGGSVAFGSTAIASGSNAAAFGNWSSATGSSSSAFGNGTHASGMNATAFGNSTTASGFGSMAFGLWSTATNGYSTAFGSYSTAGGYCSTAFGNSNSATGDYATAFGFQTAATGYLSTVFGNSTTASGDASTAFGSYGSALGWSSTEFGGWNQASGYCSTAFGIANTAPSYASVAFGQFNVGFGGNGTWSATDPVLEIGNGASGLPSDAVTIFKSGELRTHGLVQSQSGFRTPPSGDLSMGSYTNGMNPATLNPSTGLLYPSGN